MSVRPSWPCVWRTLVGMLLLGCGSNHTLVVDLRTDLRPGIEFTAVRFELGRPGEVSEVIERPAEDTDYFTGRQIAELPDLPSGLYDIRATLIDDAGNDVASNVARVSLQTPLVATLVVTRDCRGVVCGDPGTTCFSGGCQDSTCTAPDGAPCAPSECTSDAACPPAGGCVASTCSNGVCFLAADDSLCGSDELCEPDVGCRPAFEAPALIAELSLPTANDDDPTLSVDRLEIVFASSRPPSAGLDLWTATRPDVDATWSDPVLITELASELDDANPALSRDGLELFYTHEDVGLMIARRTAPGMPWALQRAVDELNARSDARCPSLTDDMLGLAFCAEEIDGGRLILFHATRTDPTSLFEPATALTELRARGSDTNPFIGIPGQRVLYFSSNRAAMVPPADSHSTRDLFVARRAETTDPFRAAVPVRELNSSLRDENAWVSDDERNVVFASDRRGMFDLFEASR